MLSLLIFIPLIVALLMVFLPKTQVAVFRWTALVATGLQLVLVGFILAGFDLSRVGVNDASTYQFVENYQWISVYAGSYGFLQINYTLGIDGLSVTMLIMSALIGFVGVISSWSITKHVKGYFISYLILVSAMTGVFVALDFFLFYLFWEMMLIPMYFLIGIWGGPRREYAAIKFFLYTFIGSLLMLLVVILFYFGTAINPEAHPSLQIHTFNMISMMDPANLLPGSLLTVDTWRTVAFVLMFIGFAVKIPMVPFHTWLPDAHVEAPTPISVILAGILLKMGTYGLARVAFPFFPDQVVMYAWTIGFLGVINIIYGALAAMGQTDLKKLIAYSSVSHMGFVLLGMASLTTEGMTGAVLQMFSHGLISAMLFLVVGVIYDRAHHRDIDGFGGLGHPMPRYTGFALFAFMASLGLPALSGFVAEALVFMGSYSDPVTRNLAMVSTLGMLITAIYYLWAYQRVYTGPVKEHYAGLSDLTSRETTMLVTLAVAILVVGVWPAIVTDLMSASVNQLNDWVRSTGSAMTKL